MPKHNGKPTRAERSAKNKAKHAKARKATRSAKAKATTKKITKKLRRKLTPAERGRFRKADAAGGGYYSRRGRR